MPQCPIAGDAIGCVRYVQYVACVRSMETTLRECGARPASYSIHVVHAASNPVGLPVVRYISA